VLGALEGVDRPALAAVFPNSKGTATVLVDVGANVDCKAQHLEQFAVMGAVYYRVIFGAPHPRLGLLSIGTEDHKGNELTREAFGLLRKLPFNFVGNVALKISEGMVEAIASLLKEALASTLSSKVGYVLSRSALRRFKKRVDYSEYGGAPLLGVKGVCMIAHGGSNANAIKNAIRVAAEFAQGRVNEKIEQELASVSLARA